MRAAVVTRYGGPEVVVVDEVPRPEPRAGDVVVQVQAVAVTSGDARIRAARFPSGFAPFARLAFGLRRPRRTILGTSFAGTVDAVGAQVTTVRPGDRVCGMTGMRMGAHAEYVSVPAAKLARTPAGVTDDDAAGVLFGGTTAWHFLHGKADVAPGSTVLVNGASGAVGTNAVQIARHLGATVTAVTSGANTDLVRAIGADHVIDYTVDDVATLDERFDVVFDAVGTLSIDSGRRLLAPGGVLVLAVAGLGETLRAHGQVVAGTARERVADMEALLGLVEAGEMTVVQDEAYDLAHIADAHRRVDGGHKRGNVIVHP